jgi:hypothetical protein
MKKLENAGEEGSFGPVILYKWKGIKCSRLKGNTGRQAPIAKKQASILGRASAVSARLRATFGEIIPSPTSRRQMYRFNNMLQQWLRTNPLETIEPVNQVPTITGFSFYENEPFYAAMPVQRTEDGKLSLLIPEFNTPNPIHPLPFNGLISLRIFVVSCNITDTSDTRIFATELEIPYSGIPVAGQELLLPIQTLPGCLTVAALSVNNMTAGIVGAFYN